MLGILKWLNPVYPLWKFTQPIARNPARTLAIASKPVASASAMLLERNKEALTLETEEGGVYITVPYDTQTLERTLAISLLPQVMIMQHLYAIPEIQVEINALWRTLTRNNVKGLPRWLGIRALFSKKAAEQAEKRLVSAMLAKGATQVGARGAGSLIPFVNVAIWIDTGILLTTGIADLLISEELEDDLGLNITPYSPIGESIMGLAGWVGNQLGISEETLLNAAEELNLDMLAKGGLLMLGDLVIDEENITVQYSITEDRVVNLDMDGSTFGQVMGLALQIATLEEMMKINYTTEALLELFLVTTFSCVLIYYVLQLVRWFRS